METKELLSCYRGLDLTDEKGMLCSKILADIGADVIKIEKPGGDTSRRRGPFYHDIADSEKSLYWFAYNTNKRGITLNLETADGRELFKKLVTKVDFITESFPPGYLDSIGLGYQALKQLNPGIVLTSITPFGQTGPYKDYAVSDIVVFALSGTMSDTGEPDLPPVQCTFPQSYFGACAEAAQATMLALYHKASSGAGQHVDVAAMESVTWIISEKIPYWTMYKYNRKRVGGKLRFMLLGSKEDITLQLIWPCKDGYIAFAFLGGLPGMKNNRKMVDWMDSKGMATDFLKSMNWAEFDLLETDEKVLREQITGPIAEFFKSFEKVQLYKESSAMNLSLYPINDIREVCEDRQLGYRNFWVELEHPELNDKIRYPGAFAVFSETPANIHRRAPLIGEHNEEVFTNELGLGKDDLVMLKQASVI